MLEEKQPELADEVKANLFTFEDIVGLERGDVKKLAA